LNEIREENGYIIERVDVFNTFIGGTQNTTHTHGRLEEGITPQNWWIEYPLMGFD
jgi:hypothetical protein